MSSPIAGGSASSRVTSAERAVSGVAARQSVQVRREEILRATVTQITQRGFANTRVTDVANSLNISSALIFYHFESKNRLLSEAFSYAAERDLQQLDRIRASQLSALRRLQRILSLYGPGSGPGQAWPLWIDAWATALRVPELQAVSRRLDVHWKDIVAAVIAEGVEGGEFRCPDPVAAAWRITALVDGLAVQATVHTGVVAKATMRRWVRLVTAAELDLPESALT
jgi:AcrR family transcriptional regulator